MEHSRKIVECQICRSPELRPGLFLGYVTPVNSMQSVKSELMEQPAFPLDLLRCNGCGLVQLGTEVDKETLFPESYPYLSGTTRILRENFAEQATVVGMLKSVEPNDLIIDIGSNDGTLLQNYQSAGFKVLGVEPSQAADVANAKSINTIKDYFDTNIVNSITKNYGKAKIVTACNVFAHIADVHNLMENIIKILDENGVFVSESHYLGDLISTLQYDTVYHEHLRYYHIGSLRVLFQMHGLEIFKVERIGTHGGSVRVFAARDGDYRIEDSVHEILQEEENAGLNSGFALSKFRQNVFENKIELLETLSKIKKEKKSIVGIGAPSRASTLVNYVGLDENLLDAVYEVSGSHKLGKFMPGTMIPVRDERELYEIEPDFALILSWHIADELMAILRRKGFRGKFIIPLPNVTILGA